MFYNLYWKNRLLVFTWHIKKELEKLGKYEEFVVYILENGEHIPVSKKQQKYNAFFKYRKKRICLSYVIHENKIILIHIKPIK